MCRTLVTEKLALVGFTVEFTFVCRDNGEKLGIGAVLVGGADGVLVAVGI